MSASDRTLVPSLDCPSVVEFFNNHINKENEYLAMIVLKK